jgi:DNA-binding HxlR family transcriptional regulator
MAALDLLSRRWTLRVLWELRADPKSFRALREACDEVSPSVLNARLAELKEAGIVESTPAGYAPTASGISLMRALAPLEQWSKEWARQLARN